MTIDRTTLHSLLARSPATVRQRLLIGFIIAEVNAALGEEDSAVFADSRFEASGIGSRAALEIKESLEEVVGQRLNTTLMFDYPTPERLAHYLAQQSDLYAQSPSEFSRRR